MKSNNKEVTMRKFNLNIRDKNTFGLVIILFGIILFMSILEPSKFFTFNNFQSMSFQFPEYGILSLGMMACMIAGGIDLSTVGIANLSSVVTATILVKMMPEGASFGMYAVFAITAAIVVGGLCGLFNGFLIGYVEIPAMLVTLAGLQLYCGLALAITKGPAITGVPEAFQVIGNGYIFGKIPVPLVLFFVLAIILWAIIKYTVYGQQLYMMGSNATASKYSGIKNLSVTLRTYMLSGMFAAVAGVIMCSRYGSAKSDYGTSYTLQTLLIVILGGVNPNGGKGKVTGVVLSVLILQVISSAFNMLRFSSFLKDFAWGAVILVVMAANYWAIYHPKTSKKKK